MSAARPTPAALTLDDVAADDTSGAVLASMGQAVAVCDDAGRVAQWNRRAEEVSGWSQAEVRGQLLDDLLFPTAGHQGQPGSGGSDVGATWSGGALLVRRDGARVPVLVTRMPIAGGHSRAVGMVALDAGTSTAGRAVQTARALPAPVLSAGDALFTQDLDGVIRTWGPGAEEVYGYTAADVVGQHARLLATDRTGADVEAALRAVAAGETVRDLETVRRRRDGSTVDISLTVSPVHDATGAVVAASVSGRDIGDRRRLERELATMATHDALTGLPNRVLLLDRLTQALGRATRYDRPLAVLFVGLDRFLPVNAGSAFAVGDQMLVEAAGRVSAVVAPDDTVARFVEDGFVIVCEQTSPAEAESLAAAVTAALISPSDVPGATRPVAVAIGIADTGDEGTAASAEMLVLNAQAAMHAAKADVDGWRTFDHAMRTSTNHRSAMAVDLRRALADEALEMHFQPVVELASGRLLGLEALLRWHHPDRGWIAPDLFLPVAEECGLAAALDDWALGRACRDFARLRTSGALPADAQLAVNMSAGAVAPDLVARVVRAADQAQVPLTLLEVELTETALTDPRAGVVLQAVRDVGVGVALDDFGTGHSSLLDLRRLPVTNIKIDAAFIRHIATRADDLAIAEAVVDLGRAVGVRTTAEGIETDHELALLHRMGCVAGQGWLWSKALPPVRLLPLLTNHRDGFQRPRSSPDHTSRTRPPVAPVDNSHGLHRMLQLHQGGASLATIAAALNGEGYRTVSDQRWHGASVARVIADRARPQPVGRGAAGSRSWT